MSFKLPDLPYAYNALEPFIDSQTMEIHHTKHHQKYIDNLNKAVFSHSGLASKDIKDILASIDSVPENIKSAIKNNGGGHANHSLFWEIMGPDNNEPTGELLNAIDANFNSFLDFKNQFTAAAVNQFGSGWAWLVLNKVDQLKIISTANQDSPLMDGLTPLLGLDVWEHAYYLKYQNRRAEYIENWWQVVNWEKVAEHFKASK